MPPQRRRGGRSTVAFSANDDELHDASAAFATRLRHPRRAGAARELATPLRDPHHHGNRAARALAAPVVQISVPREIFSSPIWGPARATGDNFWPAAAARTPGRRASSRECTMNSGLSAHYAAPLGTADLCAAPWRSFPRGGCVWAGFWRGASINGAAAEAERGGRDRSCGGFVDGKRARQRAGGRF